MEQLRVLTMPSLKNDERRENQCDTAHDIEKVVGGWRLAIKKECVGCEGYNTQCPDYSKERREK